jgi:hypothetical protein
MQSFFATVDIEPTPLTNRSRQASPRPGKRDPPSVARWPDRTSIANGSADRSSPTVQWSRTKVRPEERENAGDGIPGWRFFLGTGHEDVPPPPRSRESCPGRSVRGVGAVSPANRKSRRFAQEYEIIKPVSVMTRIIGASQNPMTLCQFQFRASPLKRGLKKSDARIARPIGHRQNDSTNTDSLEKNY